MASRSIIDRVVLIAPLVAVTGLALLMVGLFGAKLRWIQSGLAGVFLSWLSAGGVLTGLVGGVLLAAIRKRVSWIFISILSLVVGFILLNVVVGSSMSGVR